MTEAIFLALTRFVTGLISSMGYPGIVLLMGIESACIPLPSEIIMPFAGFLVFQGKMTLWLAAFAGAVGCLAGSLLAYGVGVWGGVPFLERYGKWLLISRKDLRMAHDWFGRYGDSVIFFSRLLPVIRTFISLPAGIAGMNLPKFCIYSFVGSLPWCYALAYAGMLMGERWNSIRKIFHEFDLAIILLLLLGGGLWVWRHLRPEH